MKKYVRWIDTIDNVVPAFILDIKDNSNIFEVVSELPDFGVRVSSNNNDRGCWIFIRNKYEFIDELNIPEELFSI